MITDLTGTTWEVKGGWTCDAGYGRFSVDIKWIAPTNTTFYFHISKNLDVGYDGEDSVANTLTFKGTDNYGSSISLTYSGGSKTLFFTITGGTDATNTELISWLEANGEICTQKVKGKWKFKDEITTPPESNLIDFVSNGNSYTLLSVSNNSIAYYTTIPFASTVAYKDGAWRNANYKTIDFGETEQPIAPKIYEWLIANTLPKFTRLYIGNTVATAGSKCFKRLTTEEPVKELLTVATLPDGLTSMAIGAVGTTVYLLGGVSASSEGYAISTIQKFDAENNSITTLSVKIPNGNSEFKAATVGTKIYMFGGLSSSFSMLSAIRVFDTETETITTVSNLPKSAFNVGASAVGTKIYLFGGVDGSAKFLDTINIFDTETNTITTLNTKMPISSNGYAIINMGLATVGTKIYMFGGASPSFLDTINVFDTETETITTLNTKLPFASITYSATVGTKIYMFGGNDGKTPYLDTINVFDPRIHS